MRAIAKLQKGRSGQKVVAQRHDHLTIATPGEINAGPVIEWLRAMRERQERRSSIAELVAVMSDLTEAGGKFGKRRLSKKTRKCGRMPKFQSIGSRKRESSLHS